MPPRPCAGRAHISNQTEGPDETRTTTSIFLAVCLLGLASTQALAQSAKATAKVGNGSVIVEEVRMIKGEDIKL